MDSWPFAGANSWPDPPWTMRGDVLTVWFEFDAADLRDAVAVELLPQRAAATGRARLYRLEAEATDGTVVPFQEAVLAFRTEFAGVAGEISYLMWTDSPIYQSWGREVYGWPLGPSRFEVPDDFWAGSGGTARVAEAALEFTLGGLGEVIDRPVARPNWLTPRRRFFAGDEDRADDVLIVRPEIVNPGRTRACRATASVHDRWPSARPRAAELTTGVELRVGFDVERYPRLGAGGIRRG